MEYNNKGRNPLLPWEICIPDGEAHVMPDGRVYLYGSLDTIPDGFCSGSYRVASSADLQSWQVHPTSFTAEQAPWAGQTASRQHSSLSGVTSFDELPAHIRQHLPESARSIPIDQIITAIQQSAQAGLPKDLRLYAPDAIEKDGRYYLYFCMSDDSEGVAVADAPQGPFTDAKRLPVQGIDPAVFVDDNGEAYYYWGQFSANGARLNPDMMSIDESTIREGILSEEEHHFHEGSSMRKRNGVYYYVFADTSRGKPTCLGYATGSSPLGPFTYRGVIIDNAACDPGSWNIHGSIEEVNGQWYVFYHRSSNNSQYLRRACAEPIFFDENGLIREVKMTSQGAGAPFAPGEAISARAACEVVGGAYIDADGVLQFPSGGTAVFRCFQNEQAVQGWQTNGTGAFELFADGELLAAGRAGENVSINLAPGLHELCVAASGDEACTLQEIILL